MALPANLWRSPVAKQNLGCCVLARQPGGPAGLRTSALLSAFLRRWSRNLQLFVGQRHCVAVAPGVFFACACRPTHPLKKRNGTACVFARTASRYPFAFLRDMARRASAVTQVFLKCTRSSEPRALHDFVEFCGSREYLTMATCTSVKKVPHWCMHETYPLA